MFDTSKNDAADVYKAQRSIFKKMERILIQKMGNTEGIQCAPALFRISYESVRARVIQI